MQTDVSVDVPEKPHGFLIQEQTTEDRHALSWKPNTRPPKLVIAYLIFGMVGAVLVVGCLVWFAVTTSVKVAAAPHEGEITPSQIRGFVIVLAAASLLGLGLQSWMLYVVLRPLRPERVSLGSNTFRYDPGDADFFISLLLGTMKLQDVLKRPELGMRQMYLMWGFVRDPRRGGPIEIDSSQLKGFALGRVGERQRLTFDHGAQRVEIGEVLEEPEREWLHQVLETWRQHATI